MDRSANFGQPAHCPIRPFARVEVIGDNHLIPHSDDEFRVMILSSFRDELHIWYKSGIGVPSAPPER